MPRFSRVPILAKIILYNQIPTAKHALTLTFAFMPISHTLIIPVYRNEAFLPEVLQAVQEIVAGHDRCGGRLQRLGREDARLTGDGRRQSQDGAGHTDAEGEFFAIVQRLE